MAPPTNRDMSELHKDFDIKWNRMADIVTEKSEKKRSQGADGRINTYSNYGAFHKLISDYYEKGEAHNTFGSESHTNPSSLLAPPHDSKEMEDDRRALLKQRESLARAIQMYDNDDATEGAISLRAACKLQESFQKERKSLYDVALTYSWKHHPEGGR